MPCYDRFPVIEDRVEQRGAPDQATFHPLDPLTEREMAATSRMVRGARRYGELSLRTRFIGIDLREPEKDAVLAWSDGSAGLPPREAEVVLLDREDGSTHEIVVSLDGDGGIAAWVRRVDVQPMALVGELMEAEELVRADPRFRAGLSRRGIADLDAIQVDAWPAGNFGYAEEAGRRLSRAIAFVRPEPTDSEWARPIDGLIALVDLNRLEVLRVDDHEIVPIPPESGNFGVDAVGTLRSDIAPLEIVQPDGPGFTIAGQVVEWQKWRIHVGFNAREGLVLSQIGYLDEGRLRPILYRASLSEMIVPYGDPSPTHYFKNAIDAGENGVGASATPLTLGCDCLGEIRYFDGVVADAEGAPVRIPNAICMHEEDAGVLWRHIEWRNGEGEVRRARRLVISSFSAIGNYDYGFFWSFHQDGSIAFEVKLTGVLSTGAVPPGERPRHGVLVAPQLNAMLHQHFFNMRLDLDVDGRENAVEEVWTESLPRGPENPHGNAFSARRRRFRTELEAQRRVDLPSARSWQIVNPNVHHRLGDPVAYRLVPDGNAIAFAHPDAAVSKRAAFIHQHLWVTPYARAERFAAGDYPNQHAGGSGLPEWTSADRPIADRDIVVWYTFGHHHVPRPEDWPVMPVATAGFRLEPVGFFARNPALDVPPPVPRHRDDKECCP